VIFSLPHPIEAEVAELICEMVPCAEMVRFGKNGSDATSGAIRLARAFTGRDRVAVCGYHGWQDWYIGSTARHRGVPKATRDLTHTFAYNDLTSLDALLDAHAGEFAAVILEPMNVTDPAPGFLEGVKQRAHRHGAVLVFDETITGFRYANGGAQQLFGVTPDLATFGKGLANGYPVSAVAGRREIMKLMEEIFFSFTFGGEALSLAAARAPAISRSPLLRMAPTMSWRLSFCSVARASASGGTASTASCRSRDIRRGRSSSSRTRPARPSGNSRRC
jgi:glutamate-1-semialdehyde 2,1-aminomutase